MFFKDVLIGHCQDYSCIVMDSYPFLLVFFKDVLIGQDYGHIVQDSYLFLLGIYCVYATALKCTRFMLDCTGFNSCLWSCRWDCTGIGIYCPGMEKYYSLKLLSSFETAFICFICIILSLLGRGLFERRSLGLIFNCYISLHNFVCTRQRPRSIGYQNVGA